MWDRAFYGFKGIAARRIRQAITIAPAAQLRQASGSDSYELTVSVPKNGWVAKMYGDVVGVFAAEVTIESVARDRPVLRTRGYWLIGDEPLPVAEFRFGTSRQLQLATELGFASDVEGMREGRFNLEVRVLDEHERRLCATWIGHLVARPDEAGRTYKITITMGVVSHA